MTEADASGNAQGRSQVLPRREKRMTKLHTGKIWMTGSKMTVTRTIYTDGTRHYIRWYGQYIEVEMNGAMKVIRRTEKTIWCEKDMVRWSMRIKLDPDGNEYAVDTCVPQRDRDAFTYMTDEEGQRWQK